MIVNKRNLIYEKMDLEENKFILCDDLLLIILNYVGKDRDDAKLTCKRFYQLICVIEKNKLPLKINNEIVSF